MTQSTLRYQNICDDCGYQWYPRGHFVSTRCPSCRSTSVVVIDEEVEAADEVYGESSSWLEIPVGVATCCLSLWALAMVPVFAVGMVGAWIEEDRLPLEGGVYTVIHTNKEVGKFTYVFTSVVADNIINGESTYTKGW